MLEWKIVLKSAFTVIVGANHVAALIKQIVFLVTTGLGINKFFDIIHFEIYFFPLGTFLKVVRVVIQILIQMNCLMELVILVQKDVYSVRGLKRISALIVILLLFR